MSKKLFILPALLGAFLMFAPACGDKDACKDVDCGANGICFEGDCQCDPGFEQDAQGQCTILSQGKFIGSYSVASDCDNSAVDAYVSGVSAAGTSELLLSNFWRGYFGAPVRASFSGDILTIARQEPDGDNFFVSGSGVYSASGGSGGKPFITLTFKIEDETVTNLPDVNCTAIMTLQ